MLRYMCLCALCRACVLKSMLVAMPCATLAFCLLISLFLAFWPFWWDIDLDPVAYICTPRPILKGLDLLLLHAYVCLLISMLYLHVSLSRSRLCYALHPPWVYACVVAPVPPRARLDVTIYEIQPVVLVCLICTFLRSVRC